MTATAKSCAAVQVNRRVPDFACSVAAGHTIHVDPRTGTRWGDGQYPRGWNRKWSRRKYANPKTARR